MKDRLLQLLNVLGFTATKFADEIDVQRSGISHILSGRNQPSFDFLVKILNKFPNLNAEWLILGKGKMFKDTTAQQDILKSENEPVYKPASQQNLFTSSILPAQEEAINKDQPKKDSIVTNVTFVKQVLLLKNDGSFEIYNQSKKD